MGWAVILLPDEAGDGAARRIWRPVCDVGVCRLLFTGDNRPHVSLTLLETQDGTLDEAVQAFAREAKPTRATFATLGSFGEEVIYLSPEPAAALHEMNRALTARLGSLIPFVDARYLPGEYRPHMTIAFKIPEGDFDKALRAAKQSFVPFTTVFNRVAVVKFNPVNIVGVYPLGEG